MSLPVLMVLACGDKPPPPPLAGTPEASLAARPHWASSSGYAPAPPSELLQYREEHSGDLDSRMLSCRVETSHRGDRQRLLAALRNHDTTKPDMSIQLAVRGLSVTSEGPGDSATADFGAAAVTLDSGEPLSVVLSDRGVLRQVVFDRLEDEYVGLLPQGLDSEKSSASCWVVPQDKVEAALLQATLPADRGLVLLEQREVLLYQEDFGRSVSPDPRLAIEEMAGIVGWERSEVATRVQRAAEAEGAFTLAIEGALSAELPRMPSSYSGPGLEVRSRGVSCPVFGYHRHGVNSGCVLELEVERGVGGEEFYPQLMTLKGSGYGVTGFVLPLEEADKRWAKASWRHVEEGESVLVLVELSGPEPRVLRFHDHERGYSWMRL